MNYQDLLRPSLDICAQASIFIKENLHQVASDDIITKDLNSLVTYVDQNAEKLIVSKLQALTPDAGFITEEGTVSQDQKAMNWVIDPLDGTNNFLQKLPHFAVSLGLMVDGEFVLGIVHDVMKGEVFHAVKGQGAYCNGQKISVSSTHELSQAFIATGFPYANDYDASGIINTLVHWLRNARGVRRYGAASLDLAYVAAGRFDVYYETSLNIWDIAAGALLVEEAGGQVSDFSGGTNYKDGKQIIVSNGKIHQTIVDVLTKHSLIPID